MGMDREGDDGVRVVGTDTGVDAHRACLLAAPRIR